MKIYMAPMEGITGYIFRNTYNRYFKGVDKYFTPFIAPAKGRPLRNRELKDILPENNKGLNIVPQILTNDVEGYIKTAKLLKDYGYKEVNINLGCPSGTVVAKYKGAGLLYDTDRLDKFLYGVYEADIMDVSIKTRVGRDFVEEWEDILNIYMKYPFSELIVHPRIRSDYYKGLPRMECFDKVVKEFDGAGIEMSHLCYNGDIYTVADWKELRGKYAGLHNIMLGRGLIGYPFLPEMIKGIDTKTDMKRFIDFHNELLDSYVNSDVGPGNSLFKMKELWIYMENMFSDEESRLFKRIRKSKTIEEYRVAVRELVGQ